MDDSVDSAAKVAEGSCLISSTVPRSLSLGYDPLMLGQADAVVKTHLKRFNLAFRRNVKEIRCAISTSFGADS